MRNETRAFGFFTRNSSLTRQYILDFQTPSEMSKNGIRVRYAELMTLLSIFKGTVDINLNSSHKS